MNTITILITLISISVVPALGYSPKIVGGLEATPHEFPFLVTIVVAETNANNCGGTILSNRWILTAGHCIYNHELDEFVIKAGKHDISKEEFKEQIRKPKQFIIHDLFSPWSIGPNDIGLIELAEPLIFDNFVKPIDFLPKKNQTFTGLATVSGWGSTSLTLDPEFPTLLQKAAVPVLSHDICAEALKVVEYTEKHLCAGPMAGGVGHCGGDSGGPLFIKDINGNFTVIGVASFSYNPCGTENIPAAFTRIASFINWIKKKTVKF